MTADSPYYLSAQRILQEYGAGSLSPREYLSILQTGIDGLDPAVNALTSEMLPVDEYVRESEKRWQQGNPRPLEGLPVVVKEVHPIKGHVVTRGSHLSPDEPAASTHPMVERMIEAGAIPFRRSKTPEFCIAGFTHSAMWGVTRNPWNLEYAVGGSSGGSGAALAAGYAPLATGSDIGGSIRMPASMNGVVGYKPPFGRVPTVPNSFMDCFSADGPMARTVEDVALLQNAIVGQHADDPISLPKGKPLSPSSDLRGRRIALAPTVGDYRITEEVHRAIASTAAWLSEAGAEVEMVDVPLGRKFVTDTLWSHLGLRFVPWIESVIAGREDQVEPATLQAARMSRESVDRIGSLESGSS